MILDNLVGNIINNIKLKLSFFFDQNAFVVHLWHVDKECVIKNAWYDYEQLNAVSSATFLSIVFQIIT